MCVCVCVCVFIYLYIQRETERERGYAMLFVFIGIESSVLFVGLLYISFIVGCEYRKEPERSACFYTSGHERNTTDQLASRTFALPGLLLLLLLLLFLHKNQAGPAFDLYEQLLSFCLFVPVVTRVVFLFCFFFYLTVFNRCLYVPVGTSF